jgi:hypothetical protein
VTDDVALVGESEVALSDRVIEALISATSSPSYPQEQPQLMKMAFGDRIGPHKLTAASGGGASQRPSRPTTVEVSMLSIRRRAWSVVHDVNSSNTLLGRQRLEGSELERGPQLLQVEKRPRFQLRPPDVPGRSGPPYRSAYTPLSAVR